ncbi:Cytochrome P450 [Penicillium camemberti]|uniref:Cytochrome P450 n=1 Tax=Penicillium camemberti (strain FM 013) TaxID=1429867 RepID=A0A0G4NYC3_PENC3|nr:Cytochrome P450 [Penicillium camemberti]
MIYANECMTNGLQSGLQPYNDNWKRLHRIETVFLNPTALKSYRKFHELESCSLVHNLLTVGDDCSDIITKFTQGVAFTLVLGKWMSPETESQFLELGEFALRKSTGFHWGSFLVDVCPWLNYLPAPLAPWKRLGKQMFDEEIHLMSGVIKAALTTGNWSWSEELMRQKEKENQVCYIAGELMVGAYLSSNATIHLLITTATLFPEYIRKAQAQLDEVVGADRPPSVADEDQLTYIAAFINETLRWRPVAPLGMLHAVSKDDEYMGFHTPKNSVIVANQWGLERDEEVHKDPEAFRPERWIEYPDLPLAGFGFGRRKCPGNKFSQRSLYMGLSRCLWAYDILPPAGFDREAELLNIASKGGTFPSLAPPTKAVFKIRSPKHHEVVEQSWLNIDKDENQMFADIGAKVSK